MAGYEWCDQCNQLVDPDAKCAKCNPDGETDAEAIDREEAEDRMWGSNE